MKKLSWKLKSGLIILGGGALLSIIPIAMTSCSTTKQPNKLIELNKQFIENEQKFVSKSGSRMPIFDQNTRSADKSIENIIKNAENAINSLESYKNSTSLNQNEIIWIDSYIFQWQLKIDNLKSGMIYLGSNLDGSRILSTSSNWIRDNTSSALNIYPLNPETGDPDKSAAPLRDLVTNLPNSIQNAIDYINDFKLYLDYGSKQYGFQPSSIHKKLLINQLLGFFYQAELNILANDSTKTEISLEEFTKLSSGNNYFKDVYNDLISKVNYLSSNQKNEIQNRLNNLKNKVDDFIVWYGGEYYTNPHSFSPTISSGNKIKLTKTSNSEVEKTLYAGTNGDVPIYGVGLTNSDLNQRNIGLGWMSLQNMNSYPYNDKVKNGNDVYQQMLLNNNSINTTAFEIYKQGIDLTTKGMNNMNSIATQAKNIIANGLSGNIMYDDDGIGPNAPKSTQLTGSDFEKFNLWLNQEDFFWGRESLTGDQLTQFIDKYWNNPSTEKLKKYKEIIKTQGYESNWLNKNTINGQATGTITGNQALAGAVLSLQDYINFKEATDKVFDSNFNPIKDYVISPYNYNIREDIGVGMEGPRDSQQFQYNCDPYYSLPKWSVSSLTTHEGKMGHHTQQQYWTEYLENGNGENSSGPGYTFINDAFHEGWAVFTEWFANELGIYGSNLDPNTRIPNDWLNAKGLVPSYDANKLTELTNIMKDLHAGVYYSKVVGDDNSNTKLQNSIKLANMLQYYGFLNEAQLRNMRLCLDTAYHYNAPSNETSSQNASLPFGASIKQVRDYMKNNSALGVGDISSESIRYLAIPSQATGYMLGKIIFEDLYKQVEQKLNITLVDNKTEIKKLFDLMLRNGEIPLQVLTDQVKSQYKIS